MAFASHSEPDVRADVFDVIHRRRSVRDYASEPISTKEICELIGAAVQAPSPLNEQAWSFFVVRDPRTLKHCSDEAKAQVLAEIPEGAPLANFREGLADPGFNIFYNAPVLVIICAKNGERMNREACCLAAENLMLAACGRGLGSCWIGFAEAWLQRSDAKAWLGIPEDFVPVAPIILGHPRSASPATPRRPAEITWIAGAA